MHCPLFHTAQTAPALHTSARKGSHTTADHLKEDHRVPTQQTATCGSCFFCTRCSIDRLLMSVSKQPHTAAVQQGHGAVWSHSRPCAKMLSLLPKLWLVPGALMGLLSSRKASCCANMAGTNGSCRAHSTAQQRRRQNNTRCFMSCDLTGLHVPGLAADPGCIHSTFSCSCCTDIADCNP